MKIRSHTIYKILLQTFLDRDQTGYGVHPACCPMGNGSAFPGCKAGGAWSWPL